MYTVEYADGYYIAMNGVGLINFEDPEDSKFANFVCSALNKAVEHSLHTDAEACEAEQYHDDFAEGGHNYCCWCGKRLRAGKA